MIVATPWVLTRSPRLDRQQNMMARKILADGHRLFPYAGEPRPLMGDILVSARKAAGNDSHFCYINADTVPFVRLNDVAVPGKVVGLSRVDSDGVCRHGVDAWVIDCAVWDKIYSGDIPKMHAGSHSSDWWMCRLPFSHGLYIEMPGLRHEMHARSATSVGDDEMGKSSHREWLAFAKRHNLPPGNIIGLKKNSVE
jgi:hypothetical protein